MQLSDNKTILIAITLLLIGILGILAFNQSRHETIGDVISEATEEISDEIDDHTISR